MPAAISCVTLPVDDVNKAVAFYSAALGVSPEDRDDDQASFDLDGVFLVVTKRADFADVVDNAAPKGAVSAMLSYFADSAGDVDAVLNAAKGAGADVSDAEDDDGSYSGSFTDPDGHVWEVMYDAS
jgi:predicted lactoylglutathione lyase